MRKFYAMGTWFDHGVAELLAKLEATGELKNTAFFFYVDNGYTFGAPAKSSPWEKGLRTPMFVTWPGHVPAGKRIDGLSYAIDLHATILDYAGLPVRADIQSKTLRPRIEGKGGRTHDALFGAVFAHAPHAYDGDPAAPRSPQRDVYALYVRTKDWKYVLYTQDVSQKRHQYIWMVCGLTPYPKRRRGEENLFDVHTDPYEQHNLADRPEHRDRTAQYREQVLQWWKDTGGQPISGIP